MGNEDMWDVRKKLGTQVFEAKWGPQLDHDGNTQPFVSQSRATVCSLNETRTDTDESGHSRGSGRKLKGQVDAVTTGSTG